MTRAPSAVALVDGQPTPTNIVRLPTRPSRVRLTNANATTLSGPDQGAERVYYDLGQPGLALRISSSGARTYVVTGRTTAGRSFRLRIGDARAIDVADARKAARRILGAAACGQDPGHDRRAARAAARARQEPTKHEAGPTLAQLVDAFLRAAEPRLRPSTWWSYRASMMRHVLPVLGEQPGRETHRSSTLCWSKSPCAPAG